MNLIEVKKLNLKIGDRPILNDLDLRIRDGEILGLIGDSGSGKTMTAMAVAGLLPRDAVITSGEILLGGRDLLTVSQKERRALLGEQIGLIFQDPKSSLDPLQSIGKNLDEILKVRKVPKEERKTLITDMLKTVGFPQPDEILRRYPEQLSGGQRQRVLIAGAALMKPKLLIADEPTSSLDTVTTASILGLLKRLCTELHITILFISHDIGAVESFCDRVMVMRDGVIIDSDNTEDLISCPKNAYTADLITKSRLDARMLDLKTSDVDYTKSPILDIRDLKSGYSSSIFGRSDQNTVIEDITFDVFPNEIIGLIGRSGCGKTTLAKTLCGLIKKTDGQIRAKQRSVGIVFQDPAASLNPSYTVRWHLREPLKASGRKLSRAEEENLILNTLRDVGLKPSCLDRLPRELSGGEKQRVAIATCLINEPDLIIADEPFSSLDASIQASILKLLSKINRERKTAILLITHNLSVVNAMCKRVIVMDKGRIVEKGMTRTVIKEPSAEATKLLISNMR